MRNLLTIAMYLVAFFVSEIASAACPDPQFSGSVGNFNNPATSYIVRIEAVTGSRFMVSEYTIATAATAHYYIDVSVPAAPCAPTTFSGVWPASGGAPMTSMSWTTAGSPIGYNTTWSINGTAGIVSTNGGALGSFVFNGGITHIGGVTGFARLNVGGIHNGSSKQNNVWFYSADDELSAPVIGADPLSFLPTPRKHPDALTIEALLFG